MSQEKRIDLGILAHVDAGKTTLCEAMLYKTGEIRQLGRVDHKDAFLDNYEVERNRGITVFSKMARLSFKDESDRSIGITLIDTPGHVDFAAEMERALSVIDYALLVVSGSEGVQAHTRTLFNMLRDRSIPTFIFVNKMDIAVRAKEEIIAELAEELGAGAVDFAGYRERTDSFIDGITLYSSELADIVLGEIAEADLVDNGGQEYDYGNNEDSDLVPSDRAIARAIRRGEIVPCMFGSALKLDGVEELLSVIARFAEEPVYGSDLGARVFKVADAEDGERLCFVKVTGGTLRVRDKVKVRSSGETSKLQGDHGTDADEWEAKINQIRLYSGNKYVTADEAAAGTICAIKGMGKATPGDGVGAEPPVQFKSIRPFMTYTVAGPEGMDPYQVMKDLKVLAEEDPALDVRWGRDTGDIEIRLMGQVQLEVIEGMIRSRYGYDVTFGTGRVLYLETVSGSYEGVGHFEPLRHYAEVHLIIEPAERGSGITVNSIVPEDELAVNWQRLILTHIEEKEHTGVLIGAPLTDVTITLAAGRAHEKHTNGGDFREATYRAVRNALMQARADGKAVLLEPWTEYDIGLPSNMVGRAMTDIRQMGGSQDSLEQDGDFSHIRGRVPAAQIAGYQQILTGYTSGEGRLACESAGYSECHDADAVIENTGYDPERDVENTADSVFVNHGGSDIVKWDEVSSHMHIPYVLRRNSDGSRDYDAGASAPRSRAASDPYDGLDVRERAKRRAAAEKELRMIFEKTYGAGKQSVRREARETYGRGYSGKRAPAEAQADERNLEIKAKHERKNSSAQQESKPLLVIVDGYNVIYADKYLKELSSIDPGSARDQLLDRLCNYASYHGVEMSVVFDAYKVPYGTGSEEDYAGVKVIYTTEDEPADIRIGKITDASRNRSVYVVSSDTLVQQDSWGHGALRISSGDFLDMLTRTEEEIRRRLASQNQN
ncbi:MAG: GTP-binding protein [Clostridiales bacterium]|nr:GTP-binding protein [Clostridiales bacterium]